MMIIVSATITFSDDYHVFGLWIPQSPTELMEQSKTVFVGTIISVTPVDIEHERKIEKEREDGAYEKLVEIITIPLEKYTVQIEEYLKNPQDIMTMTVLEATVSGVPSGPARIGGFETGDRVLFFVPEIDGQNQYSPESFKIPKQCDAKSVLEQPRIFLFNDFKIIQDGIVKKDNFVANKPIEFVYNKDLDTLDGSSFDVDIKISKITGNDWETVLDEQIHAKSKPCEWTSTASWEFVPTGGRYYMWMNTTEESHAGVDTSSRGFIVKEFDSPLKQIKSGVATDDIRCNDGLKLVYKHNQMPSCVKPESVPKLIGRGWISDSERFHPAIDIHSKDRIQREVDYLGLMMLLPHIEKDDQIIAVSLEGRTSIAMEYLDEYDIEIMSTKKTSDNENNNSHLSIFGNITKSNLQKFFEAQPLNDFAKRGLQFSSVGGFTDDTGTYGPFNEFLTEEQSSRIGTVLQYYEDKLANREHVDWSSFITWPTGQINYDEFTLILEKEDQKYSEPEPSPEPERFPLGDDPAFLGWDIPDVCTNDMVKFLKKYSNMFDKNLPYMSPLDGDVLDPGVNPDDMVQCENELLDNRNNEQSWKEKRKLIELQNVLDSCNSTAMQQPAIGYRYSNDTHYIDNSICEWQELENED